MARRVLHRRAYVGGGRLPGAADDLENLALAARQGLDHGFESALLLLHM